MTPLLAAPLVFWIVACGGDSTPTFNITTSAGNGGSVSPGQMTVEEGNSASFQINPHTGFEINQVSGCNGQLNGRDYTIDEVTRDCEVSASFERITFELNTEYHFSEQPDNSTVLPVISPQTATINYNEQQSFALSLPDQNWTLQKADGCPIDNIENENYQQTEIIITTGPILESCTLALYIDLPDPSLEFEITTRVINGEARIEGVTSERATFRYGEQVTVDFIPFGERELIYVSGGYSGCHYEMDGNSVNLIVTSQCGFSAKFLATEEYDFADSGLMQAFRSALELEPEELLTEDLVASATEVTLPHENNRIFSLEGIQAATNLKVLSFSSYYNLDLEPLAELALDTLHIEANNHELVNLEYLANLPLTALSLTNLVAEPADYQVLGQLTSLEYINLSHNNQLHRIDFVKELSQLRSVYLNQTGVLDIRPLLQSGLAYSDGNGHLHINGCASLEQPVTRDVVTELQQNGVSTSVNSRSNWGLCPSANNYYEGSLNASIDGKTLSLDWDVDTDGELTCALHYNLYAQQPRIADVLLEQCGASGSATLNVDLDIQTLDLYIEDNLFPNPARVAATQVDDSLNDSSQLRLAAVDWGQSTFKSNPYLVPGRSALLRAHVIADNNPAAPTLEARLYLNGEALDVDLTAPENISPTPVFDSLDASYQLVMPADWMQDGLEVELSMDGQLIYTMSPSFADPTTLYMTIVPMVVDDVAPQIPSDAALARTIKTYWPVGDVVIERRDPFIVERAGETMGAHDLLYMIRDLHAQEGALHYYHGFFNLEALGTQNAAGVAFRPGLVGVSYDRPNATHQTFAHELGHNFNIGHIDCGSPTGIEIHYPYAPEFIGSVGIDYDFSIIYRSNDASDVMSYCWPKFISDWVYEKAQDYLTLHPPQPFNAAQDFDAVTLSQPVFSTYISGVIDQVKGGSKILSHFELSQPAGRETYGSFVMIATDSRGLQTERRFAIDQTSESSSENNGYFNVRLPAFDIREVQIFHQGREVLRTEL